MCLKENYINIYYFCLAYISNIRNVKIRIGEVIIQDIVKKVKDKTTLKSIFRGEAFAVKKEYKLVTRVKTNSGDQISPLSDVIEKRTDPDILIPVCLGFVLSVIR